MSIFIKIFSNLFDKSKESQLSVGFDSQKKTDLIAGSNTQKNVNVFNIDYSSLYEMTTDLPDDFVVYDLETTGFDPIQNKIIQIGAIKFKNNVQEAVFNTYVNPQIPIPKHITSITGIRDKDVVNAPTISEVLPQFLQFVGTLHLIAHNAHFDMKFLTANKYRHNILKPRHKVVDTLSLARKYIKDSKGKKLVNYKLETLKGLLGMDLNSHNALNDCLVCAEVYKNCKNIHIEKTAKARPSKVKSVDEFDLKCFEIVKDILLKNGKSLDYLRYQYSGSYFDIKAFWSLVRIKRGKKLYILSNRSQEEIQKIWNVAICEIAVKSETGTTRIMFNNPEDLYNLSTIIVEDFESIIENLETYRKNVSCAEQNIKDYLSL